MTDTAPPSPSQAPALKDLIDAACFRRIARQLSTLEPQFDAKRFVKLGLSDLDALSIMQRVRRIAESLQSTLPGTYREQLDLVCRAAPLLEGGFVNMGLADFVARYGLEDFAVSMSALKRLTVFGTAEFAVRPFIRQDLPRALKTMAVWAGDENEHVRRLASEGSRPRLPWSFKLEALTLDPSPLAGILDALQADASPYVRRSVANSLNDISKDHPAWLFAHIDDWALTDAHTRWIVKHALRGLIKKGDARALQRVGAAETADAVVADLQVTPERLPIGGVVELSFTLRSTADAPQRLVVDYAVHYIKKNGAASAKVFKLKTLTLAAGGAEQLRARRAVRNFTTRVHYAGRHKIEVLVNGRSLGATFFDLQG